MPLDYPSQEEILENLTLFQTTFVQHFQSLLEISYNQANGLQGVKEGKKAGLVAAGFDWTRDAFGAVPVFGSFVSLGLKVPQTINRKKDEKNQKNKAKHIASMTTGMVHELVKGIIEESARELARIYEYQIGLLAGEKEVKNLAKYAAEIAVSHYSHKETVKDPDLNIFDRNNIVEAIVDVEKRFGIVNKVFATGKPTLKTCIEGLEWEVPSIFTKPGIRKLNRSTDTIECFDIEGSRPKKYGYRAEIRRYVPEEGSYIDSELDGVSKLKASSSSNVDTVKQERYEFHQGYSARSIYVLVSRRTFEKYCDYLESYPIDKKQSPKSFNAFLSDTASRENDVPLRAVYRDKPLKKVHTLNRANFSDTDFSGVRIENLTAEKAQFNNTYFIHTLFRHCTFIGASFKNVNCWQAIFEENSNLQNANVVSSNFSYVTFSEDTNFSISRSEGAIFVSSNLHEVTQVGANFDELIATLKKEAEERDRELAEKIKLLEERMEQAKSEDGDQPLFDDAIATDNARLEISINKVKKYAVDGESGEFADFLRQLDPESRKAFLPSSADMSSESSSEQTKQKKIASKLSASKNATLLFRDTETPILLGFSKKTTPISTATSSQASEVSEQSTFDGSSAPNDDVQEAEKKSPRKGLSN